MTLSRWLPTKNFRVAGQPAFATVTFKGGRRRKLLLVVPLWKTGEFDYAWNMQLAPDVLAAMADGGVWYTNQRVRHTC